MLSVTSGVRSVCSKCSRFTDLDAIRLQSRRCLHNICKATSQSLGELRPCGRRHKSGSSVSVFMHLTLQHTLPILTDKWYIF